MEAYQQRVADELKEVHDRRDKLGEFIRVDHRFNELQPVEQKLLQEQHDVMLKYEDILDKRIAIFKGREPRKPDSKE